MSSFPGSPFLFCLKLQSLKTLSISYILIISNIWTWHLTGMQKDSSPIETIYIYMLNQLLSWHTNAHLTHNPIHNLKLSTTAFSDATQQYFHGPDFSLNCQEHIPCGMRTERSLIPKPQWWLSEPHGKMEGAWLLEGRNSGTIEATLLGQIAPGSSPTASLFLSYNQSLNSSLIISKI